MDHEIAPIIYLNNYRHRRTTPEQQERSVEETSDTLVAAKVLHRWATYPAFARNVAKFIAEVRTGTKELDERVAQILFDADENGVAISDEDPLYADFTRQYEQVVEEVQHLAVRNTEILYLVSQDDVNPPDRQTETRQILGKIVPPQQPPTQQPRLRPLN